VLHEFKFGAEAKIPKQSFTVNIPLFELQIPPVPPYV
jgi:hypothetical protein